MLTELSQEQQDAIYQIRNGTGHLILTGGAGSGKSTIINHCDLTVAATTGKAALLVGGVTVDSLFAFNRKTWRVDPDRQSRLLAASTDTIIIDEASMIGRNMAKVLHEAGKRLVLVGDWAQAAPVKDDWPFETPLFKQASRINLTQNYRQATGDFYSKLNELRGGRRVDFSEHVKPAPEGTMILTAVNDAAEYYNREYLRHVAGAEHTLTAKYKSRNGRREADLSKTALADSLTVKLGCKVLITYNHVRKEYVNGDTGILTHIAKDHLVVDLDRGKTVTVELLTQKGHYKNADGSFGVAFEATGFPIKLGYALTIHKSQGMTISKVAVDVPSMLRFRDRHGLCYVAFSRVREAGDLYINEWRDDVVYTDKRALKWIDF
jgi:ATP-dependent exoDNAse (exonuclease V) alpha subunit